jgi:hypothetical protein
VDGEGEEERGMENSEDAAAAVAATVAGARVSSDAMEMRAEVAATGVTDADADAAWA